MAAPDEDIVGKLFCEAAEGLLDAGADNRMRLGVRRGAACFLTVNFSHDRYYPQEENIGLVIHDDPRDQSSTLLYLWQAEDTPEQMRAHWYDEANGVFIPIAGGLFVVFDGRHNFHGLIPPEVISEDERYAWYGSTVLMKSLQK